jgi:uncharacterized membrane protein YdjX (TVP38/TMEM64 family)
VSGTDTRSPGGPARQNLRGWLVGVAVALLGLRLIPLISFDLINYVAGLANVSWWTFTWTTAIGILPFTILFVVMGQNASSLSAGMWAVIAVAAILFLLLVRRLQERWTG